MAAETDALGVETPTWSATSAACEQLVARLRQSARRATFVISRPSVATVVLRDATPRKLTQFDRVRTRACTLCVRFHVLPVAVCGARLLGVCLRLTG